MWFSFTWLYWPWSGVTGVLKILKGPDLKLFFFKNLLDWLSVTGSHSIFFGFSLMDACNLCFWLFLVPSVYFLYTWVILFWYFNKIFSLLIYKKKKTMVWCDYLQSGQFTRKWFSHEAFYTLLHCSHFWIIGSILLPILPWIPYGCWILYLMIVHYYYDI